MGLRGGREGGGASSSFSKTFPTTGLLDGGGAGAGLLSLFSANEPFARRGGGGERTLDEATEDAVPDLLGSGGGGGTELAEVFDVWLSDRNKLGLLGLGGGAGFRKVCFRCTFCAVSSSVCPSRLVGLLGFNGGMLPDLLLSEGGGGSFLGGTPSLAWVVVDETLYSDAGRLGGVLPGFSTLTQSGSLVGVNGLLGRPGFGTCRAVGGATVERAGMPLSSHHFLLSELAGGRPGSTES